MHRSIILCVVTAVVSLFSTSALGEIVSSFSGSQSVSIVVHDTRTTSTPVTGWISPFNETVQDSFSDVLGRQENAHSQQLSTVNMTPTQMEISDNGSVRYAVLGPSFLNGGDVSTLNTVAFTFTLDTPATFSMTESSTILGSTGEIWFYGARLFPGSSVLGLTDPSLIPFIFDLPNNGSGLVESYSASLAPGTYTYYVARGGNDSEESVQSNDFTTDFVVTAVPEPLSLPLLGFGALAMLRRRSHLSCR